MKSGGGGERGTFLTIPFVMLRLGNCCVPNSLVVGFRLAETTVDAKKTSEGWTGSSKKTIKVSVVLVQVIVWDSMENAAAKDSVWPIGPRDGDVKCMHLNCTTEPTADEALAWVKPHVELLKLTRFGPLFLPRSMVTWGYMDGRKTKPIGSSGFAVDTATTDYYYVCHLATTHGWLTIGPYHDAQTARDDWKMVERELCATQTESGARRFPSGH